MEQQTPQAPQPVSAPDVVAASRFSLVVTPTDAILAIGRSRLAYGHDGKMVGDAVEYLASFSLSLTAAKQLATLLNSSIEEYELNFGKVPVDLEFEKRIADRLSHLKAREKKKSAKPTKASTVVPIKTGKPTKKR